MLYFNNEVSLERYQYYEIIQLPVHKAIKFYYYLDLLILLCIVIGSFIFTVILITNFVLLI